MTDPLSTPAIIIAVIQIGGSMLSVCYKYVGSVKDAPINIGWIVSKVGSLRIVLDGLKQLMESVSYSTSLEQGAALIPVASISDEKNRGLSSQFSSPNHSQTPILAPDYYVPLRSRSAADSALLKTLNAAHDPLTTCQTELNATYDRMGSPRELNRAIGTLAWPLKEKAVPNLRGHPKAKERSHPGNAADQARAILTSAE